MRTAIFPLPLSTLLQVAALSAAAMTTGCYDGEVTDDGFGFATDGTQGLDPATEVETSDDLSTSGSSGSGTAGATGTAGRGTAPAGPDAPEDPDGSGDSDSSATDTGTDNAIVAGPPAHLVPRGFGGAVTNARVEDQGSLRGAQFGALTADETGMLYNASYELHVWQGGMQGTSEDGLALEGQIAELGGAPLPDQTLSARITAHDDPSGRGTPVASLATKVDVVDGRISFSLPAELNEYAVTHPEVWLALELGGEVLSPMVRLGSVPSATWADTASAGGIVVDPDRKLPTSMFHWPVKMFTRQMQPGDTFDVPAGMACTHEVVPDGYPRWEHVDGCPRKCGSADFITDEVTVTQAWGRIAKSGTSPAKLELQVWKTVIGHRIQPFEYPRPSLDMGLEYDHEQSDSAVLSSPSDVKANAGLVGAGITATVHSVCWIHRSSATAGGAFGTP